MDFKVKHEDVVATCDKLKDDNEKLKEYIDKMDKDTNEITLLRTGNESVKFCEKFGSYLDKLKEINKIYSGLEENMRKANDYYKECDENFAKRIKEVVIENE